MFEHCIYFNTLALARRLESEWEKAFKPFGLTPPQAFALRAILDRPGLSPRELAQTLVISKPTATRSLDGLAARGLIRRTSSANDGRGRTIQPTPAARALHAALNEASGKVTRKLKKLWGGRTFTGMVGQVRKARFAMG
jgi:DNA-binding MarR family transcriptional regulator